MEALQALGDILLHAVPTFLLLWILYFYIARVFYPPLQNTLRQRHESTVGLRKAAEAALAKVEQSTAEYQEALRVSRAEVYRIQELERQRALDRRAEMIREAQQQAERMVTRARNDIRADVENAKIGLASESEQIALSITQAILKPGLPSHGIANAFPGGSEVAPL